MQRDGVQKKVSVIGARLECEFDIKSDDDDDDDDNENGNERIKTSTRLSTRYSRSELQGHKRDSHPSGFAARSPCVRFSRSCKDACFPFSFSFEMR